jgi:hypothetical protein
MAILLALSLWLPGCSSDPTQGYSFASSYDQRVQSISVAVFENATFHPGIEADLASALIRRVQRDTPWKVVGDATAQTSLTGVINDVQISRLTQDTAGGISQQVAVRLIMDFQWRSNVTGRLLAERRGLAVTESFIPAAGEPIDVGFSAATDEAAGAILEAMRSVW